MSLDQEASDSESRTEAVGKSRGQFALDPIRVSSLSVTPSINWNRGPNTAIRTSLRSGGVSSHSSQQSLVMPSKQAEDSQLLDSSGPTQPFIVDESFEVISISDDSSLEPAQDSNAIVLNVNHQHVTGTQNNNEPIEISDEEVADAPFVIDTQRTSVDDGSTSNTGYPTITSTSASRSFNDRQILGASSGKFQIKAGEQVDQLSSKKTADDPRKLSDLDSRDLEDQFKYALFYLDRERIDLNRAVTCLFCLEEGHMQESCPLKECKHCGAWDEHFNQNCPQWRRCLKCRARGHDISHCASKLKDSSMPCDLCGSSSHLEDKCCLQWNISSVRKLEAPVELYICCANCGQNDHLLGDCPYRKANGQFAAWTLKDVDPAKVVNLSLQKGSRKITKAEHLESRPELRIKGRARNAARTEHDDSDEDEDDFFGPRVTRNERSHIRFGDDRLDIKRLKLDEYSKGGRDSYQPRHGNDRYDYPPDGYRPNHRDRYYNPFHDERRRSRSPRRDDHWTAPSTRDDLWRPSISSPPKAQTSAKSRAIRNDYSAGGRRGEHRQGGGNPNKRRN